VKTQLAIFSFIMSARFSSRPSVRPSIRMQQLGSHWTDLMQFDI